MDSVENVCNRRDEPMNYDYFNFLKEFFGELAYDLQKLQASDPEAFPRLIKNQCYAFFSLVLAFFLFTWPITISYQKHLRRFITCMLLAVFFTILTYYEFFYDIYCMAYGYAQYRYTTLLILSELLVFSVMHRLIKKHRKR